MPLQGGVANGVHKFGSIINVGVIINEALIKFCVGDGFQTSRIQAPNSMRDVKDAVPYEHKKITLIKL